MALHWKNWNKSPHGMLTFWAGIVASATAFTPQILSVIHEAPIPVSPLLDSWVTWILKMATVITAGVTILSNKTESADAVDRAKKEAKRETI